MDLDGGGENKHRKSNPYNIKTDGYICEICNTPFADHRALAAHDTTKHGKRNPVLEFVRSTTCWACGKRFFTLPRIVQHLSKRGSENRCFRALQTFDNPLSDVELQRVKDDLLAQSRAAAASGLRSHHAPRACVRICGPMVRDR